MSKLTMDSLFDLYPDLRSSTITQQGTISLGIRKQLDKISQTELSIQRCEETHKSLKKRAENVNSDTELEKIDEESKENLDKYEALKQKLSLQKQQNQELIDLLDEVQKDFTQEPKGEEGEIMSQDLRQQKDDLKVFIRSRGQERGELISDNVGTFIPHAIAYDPKLKVTNKLDLSEFCTKIKVSTASGSHPILKRTKVGLIETAELLENPSLAKPEFIDVDWKVKTYRGALPISNEAIDDAVVNIVEMVAESAQEQKLVTTNSKVASVYKTFEAKTATSADSMKDIINVDLSIGYDVRIIASQSFYNTVDKLKDNEGRYILQSDVSSPTGYTFLGYPIAKVEDELLGEKGDAKAFVGDTKRAVLFADRKDLALDWEHYTGYGKYLAAVIRFDAVKADPESGYFVTWSE